MKYNDAYKLLQESLDEPNPIIVQVIEGIINSTERGIPIIINRNPTICYGGIIQVYCNSISTDFTMGVPLEILEALAADFDRNSVRIWRNPYMSNMVNCWEAKLNKRAC